MPKAASNRQQTRTDSESLPDGRHSELPADLPRLRRQPEKGTPIVPSHLALNNEERNQLQNHLDLVGVDKHRFEYHQKDQGAREFHLLPLL